MGTAKASRGDYQASEDDNVTVQFVSRDKGALGYFGLTYYEENQDKLRAVPIVPKGGSAGVLPSIATVRSPRWVYWVQRRPTFTGTA